MNRKIIFIAGICFLFAPFVWFFFFSDSYRSSFEAVLSYVSKAQPKFVALSPQAKWALYSHDHGGRIDFELRSLLEKRRFQWHAPGPVVKRAWLTHGLVVQVRLAEKTYETYLLTFSTGRAHKLALPLTRVAGGMAGADRYLAYFVGERAVGQVMVFSIGAQGEATRAGSMVGEARSFLLWSPRHDRLLSVNSDGLRILEIASGTQQLWEFAQTWSLKKPAWSSDAEHLLLPVRGESTEHFSLYQYSLVSRSMRPLEDQSGDVVLPLVTLTGRRYWHEDRAGRISAFSEHGAVGPQEQFFQVLQQTHDDFVYALYSDLQSPKRLVRWFFDSGKVEHVFGARSVDKVLQVPSPKELRLGERVPAYFWQAPRQRAVMIEVHGGYASYESPQWSAFNKLLLERGVSIISVNYRGSSGYGRTWEQFHLQQQLDDVALANSFARQTLGLNSENIILYGLSLGSRIALGALLAQPQNYAGLVMVSSVRQSFPFKQVVPPVVVIQGADDRYSPKKVRRRLEETLCEPGAPACGLNVVTLPGEGHNFRSLRSWAEVYAQIIDLLPTR